ncbi:Nucleoside diphosphate kinase 7 [Chytriomyces hyalinus]|nr:Nucleoside diphosphate kinase 7 [Chytriomyces hyalinus]
MSALERMCFLVEWFDVHAQLTRQYQLFFYESDNSIEMYDTKQKRTFLKRTKTDDLVLQDFHIGAAVNVYARQLTIVDYGDDFTRSKLSQQMESSLVVIKPDAIEKAGEIIDLLLANKFVICRMRMLAFNRQLAEELCLVSFGAQPYFSDYASSFEGGRAMALEVMRSNASIELQRIAGPPIVADAKSTSPSSIHAKYGHVGYKNGLHVSENPKTAKKELATIFEAANQKATRTAVFKNSTLAIIRPHAMHSGLAGKIMASICQHGYKITDAQIYNLDRVNAEEFLEVYKTVVPEYKLMVDQLTSGPLLALEITLPQHTADDIVSSFRELVGPNDPELARNLRPKSLRALYGTDKVRNAVHCTDLEADGILEVQFFFRIMASNVF